MESKRRIFVQPVLKGARFNDSSLPHEIFPDLNGYLSIVIAIAKDLYRSNHPKKRLPRAFEDRFKVRLTDIKSGSTVPVFCREYDCDDWVSDEFDQARDILNKQLLHWMDNPSCIPGFPEKIIPLFKTFGENLKSDESIELQVPQQEKAPIYSREVRSRILSINQKPYRDVCYLSGTISGFNAKSGIFDLILGDSEEVSGPLESSFDISLHEIATKYNIEEISIVLVGIAKYQPDNSIHQIERLQHVTVFKEGSITYLPNPFKRLDELLELRDGWFDGKGMHFEKEDLQKVKEWLSELLQLADIPAPFIYPSPDQQIVAEWSLGFWEVSCSFELVQAVISLHATHTASEMITEDRLSFELGSSIEKTSKFLQNILNTHEK